MAGTIENIEKRVVAAGKSMAYTVSMDITLDGSGDVSEVAVPVPVGFITDIEIVPGTTAPTDGFDLQVKSRFGADVLCDTGAGIDTSAPQRITLTPPLTDGLLYPTAASAGNGADFSIVFYIAGI